ncbi:hypothetical protein FLK61_35735 [Paenalkalicoccus suaedae]|uniref:Sporulation protein YtxC n=1 Tax=Paenalkalicoccus suaedae TaxID=2592382 RepID=A0A859FIH6_9BACI|nr:sporulation protein YtxC [Paenalkalicoccus suaedae]QKS72016.1 hypothetical protein FLK61_35735 [Paenalkalicoccus suaedae]
MLEIMIESVSTRRYFKQLLHNSGVPYEINEDCVCIDETNCRSQEDKNRLTTLLMNTTIASYFPELCETMLKELYHIHHDPERASIIAIIKRFFYSTDIVSTKASSLTILDWQRIVNHALTPFVKNGQRIGLEAFLLFRLKEVKERLIYVIEEAIDEHHLEMDYQQMVNTYRCYIKETEPKVATVHVEVGETVTFYNKSMHKVPLRDIYLWSRAIPISDKELPINQRVITPLVGMAPLEVIVDKTCDDSLYHTLQLIFEERLKTSTKSWT